MTAQELREIHGIDNAGDFWKVNRVYVRVDNDGTFFVDMPEKATLPTLEAAVKAAERFNIRYSRPQKLWFYKGEAIRVNRWGLFNEVHETLEEAMTEIDGE